MKLKLKLPVSINRDPAIVDSDGRVLLPLCWKNDADHVERQSALGRYVCSLINKSKD